MPSLKCTLIGLLAVGLLSTGGCAWVKQKATLRPEPIVAESQIGRGVSIAVRIVDRRASKIIGYRGLDSKNASITTEQDMTAVFQKPVIDGLRKKGFDAGPDEG